MECFGIEEVTLGIVLNATMDKLKLLSVTNKNIDKLCNDAHFWKLRFEKDNLVLPIVLHDNMVDWIACYEHSRKIMNYANYVVERIPMQDDGVQVDFHGISILKDIFDTDTMKKILLVWYNNGKKYYYSDINDGYDDNQYYCQVDSICIVKEGQNYRVTIFRIISVVYDYNQVKKLLYHLIYNYMYPKQFNPYKDYHDFIQYDL